MQVKWEGVFPAVTTKLRSDGSLDREAISIDLNRLIDNGVGGVVMMGMVGENAQLTPEEKRADRRRNGEGPHAGHLRGRRTEHRERDPV